MEDLLMMKTGEIKFVTGLSAAVANMAMVPYNENGPITDVPFSKFYRNLILLRIDHETLDPNRESEDSERIKIQQDYIMDPEHAFDRALHLMAAALKAMNSDGISNEDFAALVQQKCTEAMAE